MLKSFTFLSKNLPVKNVDIFIANQLIHMPNVKEGVSEIILDISSESEKYHYILNGFYWIPDDSHQFQLFNDSITSICKENNSVRKPAIDSIFCCDDIILNVAHNTYSSGKVIYSVNEMHEFFYIWCNFSNVIEDNILNIEIYNDKEIFDIITVILKASTLKKQYKRSFFCRIPTKYFAKSNKWTINARLSSSIMMKTSIQFNKLSNQLYSLNTIRK